MGWVTVLAYFVVAALCARSARGAMRNHQRNEVIFWSLLTASLFLLGFNKQLDLQTWLTLTFRRIAIAQGWYESRRVLQFLFVLAVGGAGLGSLVFMWRLVCGTGRRLWTPLVGFVLLLCFVVVRAASFHHFDMVINFRLGGVRMNWVLELGALAVLAAGARSAAAAKDPPGELDGNENNAVALS